MDIVRYTGKRSTETTLPHTRPALLSSRLGPPVVRRSQRDIPFHPSYLSKDRNRDVRNSMVLYSYKLQSSPADVLYLRDHQQADLELASLLQHRSGVERVVGFDVEWRPGIRHANNPVALVQIAAIEKILLLHISAMKEFPTRLIEFLEDSTITKAGVGILGDAQRMYRDFRLTIRSCVELSYLARSLDKDRWPGSSTELISLARLVQSYIGYSLLKGELQKSNWEGRLTTEQIHYAANDAHAGMTIGVKLLKRARHLDQSVFVFDVVHGNAVQADDVAWNVRASAPPQRLIQNIHPSAYQKESLARCTSGDGAQLIMNESTRTTGDNDQAVWAGLKLWNFFASLLGTAS